MKYLLPFLLVFLGLGALGGGVPMILDPSGKMLGTPIAILGNSPFDSFLMPGIILTLVIGIIPLILARELLKRSHYKILESLNVFSDMHWSWSFTIYIGFALIIWIQAQEIFINSVHWLHTFYMFWALLIFFIALIPKIRNHYKKRNIH